MAERDKPNRELDRQEVRLLDQQDEMLMDFTSAMEEVRKRMEAEYEQCLLPQCVKEKLKVALGDMTDEELLSLLKGQKTVVVCPVSEFREEITYVHT